MSVAAFWVVLATAAAAVHEQPRFPMKYLDEVGNLGGLDKRSSVDLGIAKVVAESEGELRFEGRDVRGKYWRVWIPAAGGMGGTDVWTADFDRNGRQDLLIAAHFPGNGRCIDGVEIYTLMFDDLGRPVPWVGRSNSFAGFKQPPLPVIDANGDGRAEMVTVSCEYAERRFSEHRQVSGIYEAGGARWPDFLAGYDTQSVVRMRSLITGGQVVYADGQSRQGWPLVMIDTSDGRYVFLSDCEAALLSVLKMGYSFRLLGDALVPDLLWAESRAGARVGQVSCRLRTGDPKRIELKVREGPAPERVDITLSLKDRCFAFSSGEGHASSVTELRNCGAIAAVRKAGVSGGERGSYKLTPVAGTTGTVAAAVVFGYGWLLELRAGPKRWLVLHSQTGKPISSEMELPVDGHLFDSTNSGGLRFLKWANGKPVELISVNAAVEWSKSPD